MEEINASDLLSYEPLLARIVRDIVNNDDVPDVLQRTWLAAVRGPRPEPTSLGPWLARVARNFAYEHLRLEGNRRAREMDARSPNNLPHAEALLQRQAIRTRVADAVQALPEPYRRSVFLRYIMELSYPDIARELDTNEAAVRQRVKRGLDQLRARLLRDEGDADQWLSVVGVLGLPTGERRMIPWTSVACVAGTLAATLAAVWIAVSAGGDRVETSATPGVSLSGSNALAVGSIALPLDAGALRETARDGQPSLAVDRDGSERLMRGRVLDPAGAPLAGLALRVPGSDTTVASTDAQGEFAIPFDRAEGGLTLAAPFVAAYSSTSSDGRWLSAIEHHLIVAAPRVEVAGTVRDALGQSVSGVRITAMLTPPVGFPHSLAITVPWMARSLVTVDGGRFSFVDLPAGCVELVVQHPSSQDVRVPIERDDRALDIVLQPSSGDCELLGRVRDADGRPVQGATIGAGIRRACSERDGSYRLALDRGPQDREPFTVFVAHAGHATEARALSPSELSSGASVDWTLTPAQPIAGRVLDADGLPKAGYFVIPWDEEFVTGRLGATDLAQPTHDRTPSFFGLPNLAVAVTDEHGAFRVDGFGPGEHSLGVVDPALTLTLFSEHHAAGSRDVEIRVPRDAFRPLDGRIVAPDGAGAEGVRVELVLEVARNGVVNAWRSTQQWADTDRNGVFRFPAVPRTCRLILRMHRPPSLFEPTVIEPDTASPVEIVFEPLRYFRLDLSNEASASGVARLLDADGAPVAVIEAHQGLRMDALRAFPLRAGKSSVLATSTRARTLVLDADPTFALPFELRPDEVTTIGG